MKIKLNNIDIICFINDLLAVEKPLLENTHFLIHISNLEGFENIKNYLTNEPYNEVCFNIEISRFPTFYTHKNPRLTFENIDSQIHNIMNALKEFENIKETYYELEDDYLIDFVKFCKVNSIDYKKYLEKENGR